MLIERIASARIAGAAELVELRIAHGRVAAVGGGADRPAAAAPLRSEPPGAAAHGGGEVGAASLHVGPPGAAAHGGGEVGAASLHVGPPGAAAHGGGEVGAASLHVGPPSAAAQGSGEPSAALDAGGLVVVPAFVDAHVHLDKAFLLERAGASPARLESAILTVADLRSELTSALVLDNARRALALLIQNGVTAARVHVEIDPLVGLELVHLQQALAEEFRAQIALQLVAFPQRGLELAGMLPLMAAAMREGLAVVGGCPYVDREPARHLDHVFALAELHGTAIDLHLDFNDDPSRSLLRLVAERVRAHGMQGRVTIGHVTTLAAMTPDDQAAALALLAEAGIALVLVPATDLFLAGHGEPGTRSVAPFERARAAGVRVAIANNNLQNPFAPFGNGNLAQAAWLTGIIRRAAEPCVRAQLFEAIGSQAAAILGLPEHGPSPGALAHLALLDATRVEDVVLMAPPVLASLRAGRLVYRRTVPQLMAAD